MTTSERLLLIDKLTEYKTRLTHDSKNRRLKACNLLLQVLNGESVKIPTTRENHFMLTKIIEECKVSNIVLSLELSLK